MILLHIQLLEKLLHILFESDERAFGAIKTTRCLVRPVQNDPDHDYELIDGERRWRAAQLAEIDHLKVVIIELEDEQAQFLISIIANFAREEHSPMEVARACKRLKEEVKLTNEQVAQVFGKSVGYVNQYYSLNHLVPELQALMEPSLPKEDRLRNVVALQLAKLSPTLQVEAFRRMQVRVGVIEEDAGTQGASQVVPTGRGVSQRVATNVVGGMLRDDPEAANPDVRRRERDAKDLLRMLRTLNSRVEDGAATLFLEGEKLTRVLKLRNPVELTEIAAGLTDSINALLRLVAMMPGEHTANILAAVEEQMSFTRKTEGS